jgi:hypothetical protein
MQDRGKDSFVGFGYSPIEVAGGMAPLPELVGADVGDFESDEILMGDPCTATKPQPQKSRNCSFEVRSRLDL